MVKSAMKKIRESRGETQESLAEMLGCTQRWVSALESDVSVPTIETLTALCTYLEVHPEEIGFRIVKVDSVERI